MLLHATTWRSLNHFFDDYRNISIRWRKASKNSERKENDVLGDYIFTETFETTGTQLIQESFSKKGSLNGTIRIVR